MASLREMGGEFRQPPAHMSLSNHDDDHNDDFHKTIGLSDVTGNDSQRRFLAQKNVAILEQHCNHSKQCRNNDATLCCAKNHRCESSRVTSP